MGRFLNEARHHYEKIEHYYKHAGANGYSQASYHWHTLSDRYASALRSKAKRGNPRADAASIQSLIAAAGPMVDEMKKREEEATGD